MRVLFDDSLPQLVAAIVRTVGPGAFADGVVLRDVTGQLAFFSGVPLDDVAKRQLTEALRDALGSYARTDRLLRPPQHDGRVLAGKGAIKFAFENRGNMGRAHTKNPIRVKLAKPFTFEGKYLQKDRF